MITALATRPFVQRFLRASRTCVVAILAAPMLLFGTTGCDDDKATTAPVQVGLASFYGDGFDGNPTANGEIFDRNAMTAAHKNLAFNTMVEVTDIDTGKTIVVRINDRGPFIPGRIIDLSEGAAKALGTFNAGVAEVMIAVQ